MENNIIENNEPEMQVTDTAEAEAAADAAPVQEITPESSELIAALIEARVKLALLLCGADKEKLDEAARIALGLVGTGIEPEEAAAEAVAEYPHLKLASRAVPVFAAQSKGSSDGFAAIKSIFAKR